MLDRALRLLRPRAKSLHWLRADLAIGDVSQAGGWREAYEAGIRAVVNLGSKTDALGDAVRGSGMRYLHLAPREPLAPNPEELHIVTAWILERTGAGNPVLVRDEYDKLNDGLVAAAALIRRGLPAYMALIALQRARPDRALSHEQNQTLVRFAGLLGDRPDTEAAT